MRRWIEIPLLRARRVQLHRWGVVAVALALVLNIVGTTPRSAAAQDPEAQAQAIERKLLCPQCTNLRLDICDTVVCRDMRAIIRERLAAGDSPDQIVNYFTDRYGQRVLAEVPRSGFNLVLFGWVGTSLATVIGVGTFALSRMRRTAKPAAATADADERWLDQALAADRQPADAVEGSDSEGSGGRAMER